MKKEKVKTGIVLCVLSMIIALSFSRKRDFDSVVLSNVEALSLDESYQDKAWNVEVRYYDGELTVSCTRDGSYICPLVDPGTPV